MMFFRLTSFVLSSLRLLGILSPLFFFSLNIVAPSTSSAGRENVEGFTVLHNRLAYSPVRSATWNVIDRLRQSGYGHVANICDQLWNRVVPPTPVLRHVIATHSPNDVRKTLVSIIPRLPSISRAVKRSPSEFQPPRVSERGIALLHSLADKANTLGSALDEAATDPLTRETLIHTHFRSELTQLAPLERQGHRLTSELSDLLDVVETREELVDAFNGSRARHTHGTLQFSDDMLVSTVNALAQPNEARWELTRVPRGDVARNSNAMLFSAHQHLAGEVEGIKVRKFHHLDGVELHMVMFPSTEAARGHRNFRDVATERVLPEQGRVFGVRVQYGHRPAIERTDLNVESETTDLWPEDHADNLAFIKILPDIVSSSVARDDSAP